jgi:D-glycero-D-manno-heptose 1,7-bisphosphate phosphatase
MVEKNRKAVFLDRDGTLNRDTGYLIRFEDFELIPGVESALLLLQQLGYRLFVVTNQSGVARGYFSFEAMETLHRNIMEFFEAKGIHIEEIAACPHHIEGIDPRFTMDCDCRKPKPGMILQLGRKYKLDLSRSFMAGDKLTDAQTGVNAGTTGVWIRPTGTAERLDNPGNIKEFHSLLDFARSLSEIN